MKTLLTLLLLLCVVVTQAQTGKLMKRYYISGSLSVGKGDRSFADTSAWLEIGADTTQKGIIFPRVLLDSIKTEKRAVFVYDLQDSVLYHFDGNERVRYMTYKDTTFLKDNFLLQGGNTFGRPLVVGSKDNQPVDIIANGNNVLRAFANGNLSVGADTITSSNSIYVNGNGDETVLRLHKNGESTFLKTTTNNDNAYTHVLAIGNHRIKTKNYGISFSSSDNEDQPIGQDMFRIKNVYNSTTYNPLKVLGANEEPYFTINGLGNVLVGTNNDIGYKLNVNGNINVSSIRTTDIDAISNLYSSSAPYLKITGNESVLLQSSNGNNGGIILGLTGVSPNFTVAYSGKSKSYLVTNRDVTPVLGSENLNYNTLEVRDVVNYSNVTGNNVYRGIFYNPSVVGNVEQHAIELNNTVGWGFYQKHQGVKNLFAGQTSFANGSLTDNNGDVTISVGRVVGHKSSFWVTDNAAMDADKTLGSFTTIQSPDIEYAVKASNSNTTPANLNTGLGSAFYAEKGWLGYHRLNYLSSANDFYGYYNNNYAQNSGGTTSGSNAYSFISGGQIATSGTDLGNVIDFWAKEWSSSQNGSINNRYALKIDFTGSYTNNAWGIYQSSASVKNHFNGKVFIGTTTDAGYQLDVNGTTRMSGDVIIKGGLVFNRDDKTISITEGNTSYQPVSINVGRSNVLNSNDNARHITIGNNNTGNTAKIWQYMIGQGNNLSTAELGNYSFGDYNTISSGDTYQYIFGSNNTINYPSTTTSRGQFIIGSSNSLLHKYSSIMGNNQSTTGDNQLIFAGGNANTNAGGYRDVYFGSGPVSSLSTGIGAPVTINSSGGKGTDKAGGILRLAAGKSTGSATSPDLIFSTTTSEASSNTLQTLTDRWYVKGETGRLSNNITPTALLDIDAPNGYDQLRMRTSYTPTSSGDSNGNVGDVSWDDGFIYIKTSTGWKRSQLLSF